MLHSPACFGAVTGAAAPLHGYYSREYSSARRLRLWRAFRVSPLAFLHARAVLSVCVSALLHVAARRGVADAQLFSGATPSRPQAAAGLRAYFIRRPIIKHRTSAGSAAAEKKKIQKIRR